MPLARTLPLLRSRPAPARLLPAAAGGAERGGARRAERGRAGSAGGGSAEVGPGRRGPGTPRVGAPVPSSPLNPGRGTLHPPLHPSYPVLHSLAALFCTPSRGILHPLHS